MGMRLAVKQIYVVRDSPELQFAISFRGQTRIGRTHLECAVVNLTKAHSL